MQKKALILLSFLLCLFALSFSADPFYTNLLNEGKQQLVAGKLDEALESFKLAEFGLVDEREYVPELYYYFALAQYKKGQLGESQALLDKMKLALGGVELERVAKPREIANELVIMLRTFDYLKQPGAKPGIVPFLGLFYEAWDLLKARKLPEAEAKVKLLGKMNGDDARRLFLEGYLSFLKGDYKRCLGRLEKIAGPLPAEFAEDASFFLAYSYLKRGDLKEGEKWAQKIKNPEHVHQLMDLMDEIKEKSKKK